MIGRLVNIRLINISLIHLSSNEIYFFQTYIFRIKCQKITTQITKTKRILALTLTTALTLYSFVRVVITLL